MFGGTKKTGWVLVFGLFLNLVHSEYRQHYVLNLIKTAGQV
jgi:hypothetical protein